MQFKYEYSANIHSQTVGPCDIQTCSRSFISLGMPYRSINIEMKLKSWFINHQ